MYISFVRDHIIAAGRFSLSVTELGISQDSLSGWQVNIYGKAAQMVCYSMKD